MADVTQWSPLDANNNQTPPDGWPEGMSASAVNDTGRSTHGGVRRLAEDGGWFDFGHAYSYVSGTEFQAGNVGTDGGQQPYQVGRKVRVRQPAGGPYTNQLVGTITGTSGTVPTINVTISSTGTIQNATMDVQVGLKAQAQAETAVVGELKDLAYEPNMADLPGWLKCGQAVSRTTYATLFGKVGTTWGVGDGTTTFDLPPNARIAVASGVDGGSTFTVGQTGGAETHQLTEPELPTISQSIRDPASDQDVRIDSVQSQVANNNNINFTFGNDQPHNNMQPYMVVARIIYAGA